MGLFRGAFAAGSCGRRYIAKQVQILQMQPQCSEQLDNADSATATGIHGISYSSGWRAQF